MKYFLIGAFATGFLVYGMALVYGATGGELSLRRDRRARRPTATQAPLFYPRRVLHPHRARLQGRRGAVPHVGARRLRGRADAGDRVHGRRREGRRVRRASSACSAPRSASPLLVFDSTGWASIAVGARGADDDARQPGGAPPGQHQAHAGVLVDRARRLPAGRRRRHRASASPSAQAGGALLPHRLHLHDAGRVRRGRLDRQPQRRAPARRRLGRPRRRAPGASRWR